MNHSFYSADRTTYSKVVIVALIAAMAVASFTIAAHASHDDVLVQAAHVSVIKAGKPPMIASGVQLDVR